MTKPKEFAKAQKVCRLNKGLYGLKQVCRLRNIKLVSALNAIRFY